MRVNDLAARLNLRVQPTRREWRGDCPHCHYRAAFVVTEKDGRTLWWCASCQDRDGVTAAVLQAAGSAWVPDRTLEGQQIWQRPPATRKSEFAQAFWDAGLPFAKSPSQAYLSERGLTYEALDALRYHPATWHPSGQRLPAMLAAVRDTRTGEFRAVHRTFLRVDGAGKAAVDPTRASLGPVSGGAVQLQHPSGDVPLVVAEGIETALSAATMIGGAAWSAVSAGNLATLPLPPLPACPVVVIAADPDRPGLRAANAAGRRWQSEGRSVRIATPDRPGVDFNDLLRARIARQEDANA